jgi:hypothetical protein
MIGGWKMEHGWHGLDGLTRVFIYRLCSAFKASFELRQLDFWSPKLALAIS